MSQLSKFLRKMAKNSNVKSVLKEKINDPDNIEFMVKAMMNRGIAESVARNSANEIVVFLCAKIDNM